jgi:hypothetical protein
MFKPFQPFNHSAQFKSFTGNRACNPASGMLERRNLRGRAELTGSIFTFAQYRLKIRSPTFAKSEIQGEPKGSLILTRVSAGTTPIVR